jgi:hypothetical protein
MPTQRQLPSLRAVHDPELGLVFYALNSGKKLKAPKKLSLVRIHEGGRDWDKWTWMEHGQRAWAYEKPTRFLGLRGNKSPSIALMVKAMDRTKWQQWPLRQWYDDPKVEKVINQGVALGWLRRPSTTQVEWTDKGVDEAKRKLGLFGGTGTLRQAPKLETLVAELNATLKK